jgi:hypothetical protein
VSKNIGIGIANTNIFANTGGFPILSAQVYWSPIDCLNGEHWQLDVGPPRQSKCIVSTIISFNGVAQERCKFIWGHLIHPASAKRAWLCKTEQHVIAFDLEKPCETGKDYFHDSIAQLLSLGMGGTFQYKAKRVW